MEHQGAMVSLPLDFSSVTDEDRRRVREAVEKVMNEPAVDWQARALAAEKKLEALELVASYAKDVVAYWPSMTFRTIRVMIPKMDALKEALSLVK